MWNYIFYKTYLNWKVKTEFDGNETYVYSKIIVNDLCWFPIGRLLINKYL
jgi:hypothetical protein